MRAFLALVRRLLVKVLLIFLITSVSSVILFRFVPIPVTPLMLIRLKDQKMAGEDLKLKKDWKSLDEISDHLELAVVCAEDQNFLKHNGFDLDAIEKAMEHNKHSKKKRGASTISQQTAKNVFLWPKRSWLRKGLEVYFTFLIELFWNKERILEVYLNVVEMGRGVYGAEAASQYYYGSSANKLSRSQAAGIAAVLPSPRKWSPKSETKFMKNRKGFVLRQMQLWGGELNFEQAKKE